MKLLYRTLMTVAALASPLALASLAQGMQEEAPVFVIGKDRLAPVPSWHDMVKGTWELEAETVRHGGCLVLKGQSVKSC